MKYTAIYFLIFTAIINVSFGQSNNTNKIEIGISRKIQSKILNEPRELFIYSPRNISANQKYPVIYLFDAESLFLTTVSAVKFLNYNSYMPQMPEAYIVGIVNTKRDRDMPVPQEIENNKDVEKFYQFLSQELVPYINKNFPTSGLNILAGHSQGGLFVTYAAVQNPALFPFVIAMDAPMTVTKSVEQLYSKKLEESCHLKYVSAEGSLGWKNTIKKSNGCLNYSQIKIEGESHETMPYKAIYEGLKLMFDDYLPTDKDWSLQKITEYYKILQQKYHVSYPIPSKILLESAKQNIGQSKKIIAVELINENDKLYGQSSASKELLVKANAIIKESDVRVTYSLSQPSPSEDAINPFLGKWSGVVIVPGGTNMEVNWEIKKNNGRYQMESDIIKAGFKSKSDFLYVNEKKELVWGRKHDGGGIYISIGKLSNGGLTITGTEDLIGFDFPNDWPAFKKNSFEFKKQ